MLLNEVNDWLVSTEEFRKQRSKSATPESNAGEWVRKALYIVSFYVSGLVRLSPEVGARQIVRRYGVSVLEMIAADGRRQTLLSRASIGVNNFVYCVTE